MSTDAFQKVVIGLLVFCIFLLLRIDDLLYGFGIHHLP